MTFINAIRSIFFNILFYSWTAFIVISLSFTRFAKTYGPVRFGLHAWARVSVFLARWIMGIKVEVRGLEAFPKTGALILAAKHQSNIDPALAFLTRRDVTALAKKELFTMPFMGSVMRSMGVICVDRGKGTAHKSMDAVKDKVVEEARPLIIYPEGTRVPVGQRRKLKSGAYHIHADHHIPVYTVASNAGYFWSKGFWHKPGTIVYEIHTAVPDGLSKSDFMAYLHEKIVVRSDVLMREAGADLPPLEDQPMRGKGKH